MKSILTAGLLATSLACGCASTGPTSKPIAPQADPPPARQAKAPDDSVHDYVDEMREDLADGKVIVINDVMKLTDAEDKVFWPIYNNYEQDSFALGDQRLALMKEFVVAQDNHALTDAKAAELTTRYFQFEQDRLDLIQKYTAEMSKALSPIRAAQFAQIEHRFTTVVDLMIASQMPLVAQTPPSDAASR
jgi:hypothetical protein